MMETVLHFILKAFIVIGFFGALGYVIYSIKYILETLKNSDK